MTTAPATHVVGSASVWVHEQLAGPRRVGKVLHAGRSAVYVDLAGSCLGVLAVRAVQVPCGVRTMLPALPRMGPGDEVVVTDGSIGLPGCEVVAVDVVDATVPALPAGSAAWGAEQLARHASTSLRSTRESLPVGPLHRLASGDPGSVTSLLGLGPGLTPVGDDVLCGWLATAVACRLPVPDGVRSAVALEAPRRTTTLSATLLGCAARGEGVPELRRLLRSVASEDVTAVEQSVERIRRVGETSGAGLLLGALLALEAAA